MSRRWIFTERDLPVAVDFGNPVSDVRTPEAPTVYEGVRAWDDVAMPAHVLVTDSGPIRTVTLSHPEKRNALTHAMLRALIEALPASSSSSSQPIRVVVLRGDGGVFSSGFYLGALDDAERARGVDPITPAADAIAACPLPVIAAVETHCHGGAVELCAACPIVVAHRDTSFSVPAVRLGLVYPAAGLRRFRRRLGHAAERVLLTGTTFSAGDARTWGLVHDVVDDVGARAHELASAIARAAPLACAGTLAALRAIDDDEEDSDALIADARTQALQSDDFAEGLRAWRERRPPTFLRVAPKP
jgi:enoyl-CoA hydratase/carnithine racemase